MLFFKMKNLFLWLVVTMAIISISIIFYYRFDNANESIPIFVLAIPFAILLLSFTFYQIHEVAYEKDLKAKIINGYD